MDRQATIISHLGLVRAIANHHRRLPLPLEDLIAEGTAGLIAAVDRFDTSKGVDFATYARRRISGAMIDAARSWDFLTRADRRNEDAYCRRPVSFERLDLDCEWEPADDNLPDPIEVVATAETSARVAAAVANLTERERQFVYLRFGCDRTLREVGEALGVKEARACQIEKAMLAKLREVLAS